MTQTIGAGFSKVECSDNGVIKKFSSCLNTVKYAGLRLIPFYYPAGWAFSAVKRYEKEKVAYQRLGNWFLRVLDCLSL